MWTKKEVIACIGILAMGAGALVVAAVLNIVCKGSILASLFAALFSAVCLYAALNIFDDFMEQMS